MPYELTIEERPTYLYAKVVGPRTAENALRFLEETYAACVKSGRSTTLLDMQFSGPSLDTVSIYDVLLERVAHGRKLRKIAYIEAPGHDPAMPYFAETVAMNRGVNVRLFQNVAAAEEWLSDESDRKYPG
jgi:hypothetical protein